MTIRDDPTSTHQPTHTRSVGCVFFREALAAQLAEAFAHAPAKPTPQPVWVVRNYLDREYLREVLGLARGYGVKTVCLADGYFDWPAQIVAGSAAMDLVADIAADFARHGLEPALMLPTADHVRELGERVERQIGPIRLVARETITVLDAACEHTGWCALPHVDTEAVARSIAALRAANASEVLVAIDHSGRPCLQTPSWINVFGVTFLAFRPDASAKQAMRAATDAVFGDTADPMRTALVKAGEAVNRLFTVMGTMRVTDRSAWPREMAFFDRQLEADAPPDGIDETLWREHRASLSHPTAQTILQVDLEKIEGLERAYEAMDLLEAAKDWLGTEKFLWMEHYFQRLKAVGLVLRRLSAAAMSLRGAAVGSCGMGIGTLRAKLRELEEAAASQQAIVGEMPTPNRRANSDRLRRFIEDGRRRVDELALR